MTTDLPLDLDVFADLETDTGLLVDDLEFFNGHYLVYKIPDSEESLGHFGSRIILPPAFRKRSVSNMSAIRGFVLKVTRPFKTKHSYRELYWDYMECDQHEDGTLTPRQKYRWRIRHGQMYTPTVKPGDCVLYNSYNVAKIPVRSLDQPLIVVRHIDIEAVYPSTLAVELGDHALRATHSVHS